MAHEGNIIPKQLHQGEDFEFKTENSAGEGVTEVNSSSLKGVLSEILIELQIMNTHFEILNEVKLEQTDIED